MRGRAWIPASHEPTSTRSSPNPNPAFINQLQTQRQTRTPDAAQSLGNVPVPGSWDPVGRRFILDPGTLSTDTSKYAMQVTATHTMLKNQHPAGQQEGKQEMVPQIGIATTERMRDTMAFARDLATHLGSITLTLPSGENINICT